MERGKKNVIDGLTEIFCSEYSRSRRTYAGDLHHFLMGSPGRLANLDSLESGQSEAPSEVFGLNQRF
jgi:molybdenum cofactor biosynthesis enzyme MoaA